MQRLSENRRAVIEPCQNDIGAAMAEYGLMVAGVAVAVAVFVFGEKVVALFNGLDFGG